MCIGKDQVTWMCARLKVKKFMCPLEFWAAKHHVRDLEEEGDDEERSPKRFSRKHKLWRRPWVCTTSVWFENPVSTCTARTFAASPFVAPEGR